jgi:hypothetical protein
MNTPVCHTWPRFALLERLVKICKGYFNALVVPSKLLGYVLLSRLRKDAFQEEREQTVVLDFCTFHIVLHLLSGQASDNKLSQLDSK